MGTLKDKTKASMLCMCINCNFTSSPFADYGLVVMCSSENEDRANIVAALDQYRVAAPPCPSSNDLQSYLKKHLRIPTQQYGYINSSKITWEPAGTLDPEK